MRYAALVLILAAATTASASQVMVELVDGRAECIGFDPEKLSVAQSGQDWRVQSTEYNGFILGVLSTKEDADAAHEVIKKKHLTAVCTIGKGTRTFRYFESVR